MSDSMRATGFRAAVSAAVLALFYWTLFQGPADFLGQAVRPSVDDARALADRAWSLVHAGRYEEALGPMLKLSESNPNDHIYVRQLAEISRHLGNLQDEARYWEQFVRLSPMPIEGCPRIGEVYWQRGLVTKSVGAFERCLTYDSQDPDAVFYLARAYEWTEQYEAAQQLYERGVRLDSQYLDMHLGLARLELRRGHTTQAKAGAFHILRDAPENVDAMLIAGLAFQRDGNRREARKYLERGVKLNDTYADFHLALGILAEEEQQVDHAMQQYSRTLALDATNRDAARRRDQLAARMKP